MPDTDEVGEGSQSRRGKEVAFQARVGDAKASSGEANVEGERNQSFRFGNKGSDQAAPGRVDEEPPYPDQYRNYQSGFSNEARSTGDDSAPQHREDSFDDGNGPYPRGRTRRTPKQQEQNKRAQQRYREKRKAHFDELQGTVNTLIVEMQASERERRALESELVALKRLGVGQHLASTALPALQGGSGSSSEPVKAIMQALVSLGALPSNAASLMLPSAPAPAAPPPPPVAAVPPQAAAIPASPADSPTFPPEIIHQMLGAFQTELWSFLTKNNMLTTPSLSADSAPALPMSLLPQATDLINMGIELAKQILNVSGPESQLLLHDGAQTTHPCAADEISRWQSVVAAVAPTPEQVVQITAWRNTLISSLQTSYRARMELKTAGFQALGTNPETGAPRWAESILLHAASNSGYGLLAQANADLYCCLEKLKQLVDEDRAQIQSALSFLLLEILTPLQAVKYLAKSHPFFWNVLSFGNNVVVSGI